MSFTALWESLLPVGRDDRTGGYRRFSWSAADLACRDWFRAAAAERGLAVRPDGNGNLWAWQDPPGSGRQDRAPAGRAGRPGQGAESADRAEGTARAGAVVTGSHLDSVPDGGAFDGPLGIASGFAALDLLRARGATLRRPVAVAAFCEEEGARFGVACLGSRLLTGAIAPGAARALRDGKGVTLAEAMAAAGQDPGLIGPDEALLAGVTAFVELHIEQGRALADVPGAVIAVASGIWPHGRWRLRFTGRADHAGTARLAGRRDPMLPFAATVLAARQCAARLGTLATIGKVAAEPGGVNAVSASVQAWLDARAQDQAALDETVAMVSSAAAQSCAEHGVELEVSRESSSPGVSFDQRLGQRVSAALAAAGISAPVLGTGAGHDAGVLAARLPAAMLFVRNPTGVSHAPGEHADLADCEVGVTALAAVLEELACQ